MERLHVWKLLLQKKKREAVDRLVNELDAIRNKKATKSSDVFTELREPTDYKTNPKFKLRDIPIKNTNEEEKEIKEKISQPREEVFILED